jgi:hypothetical protein
MGLDVILFWGLSGERHEALGTRRHMGQSLWISDRAPLPRMHSNCCVYL